MQGRLDTHSQTEVEMAVEMCQVYLTESLILAKPCRTSKIIIKLLFRFVYRKEIKFHVCGITGSDADPES